MSQPIPIDSLGPAELRAAVAERYGRVATDPARGVGFPVGRAFAESVGYPAAILDTLPIAASASFAGVTYLPAWINAAVGESVIDLGCGAGLDSLVAAQRVGPTGHIHAIDASTEMAELARWNAGVAGLTNVLVHIAPAEALPVPDGIADLVMANGVINLSPEKERVAAEAFRMLKPGGRFVGAEIVLTEDIPRSERGTLDDWFR